jgi:hypothetical protein
MSNELRQEQRQKLAGKGYTFPNHRPIRRAQDGAPGCWGLVEENRQRQLQKADPCGMTNKRTSNSNGGYEGALGCPADLMRDV